MFDAGQPNIRIILLCCCVFKFGVFRIREAGLEFSLKIQILQTYIAIYTYCQYVTATQLVL